MTEIDGLSALHAAGDSDSAERLSALLGRRLGRAFRAEDLVTHAAPGRFVVAAFGMKSEDGVQRLAELLEGFRDQSVEGADRSVVAASFSAGIAQIRLDGPDAWGVDIFNVHVFAVHVQGTRRSMVPTRFRRCSTWPGRRGRTAIRTGRTTRL